MYCYAVFALASLGVSPNVITAAPTEGANLIIASSNATHLSLPINSLDVTVGDRVRWPLPEIEDKISRNLWIKIEGYVAISMKTEPAVEHLNNILQQLQERTESSLPDRITFSSGPIEIELEAFVFVETQPMVTTSQAIKLVEALIRLTNDGGPRGILLGSVYSRGVRPTVSQFWLRLLDPAQ